MAIPNYQKFMLPVLKAASKGDAQISKVVDDIADELKLSEEEINQRTSTGSFVLYSRISWAKSYLLQAGLIDNLGRGFFAITEEGKKILSSSPSEINNKMLKKYPSFMQFTSRAKKKKDGETIDEEEIDLDELSPEEAIQQSIANLNDNIANQLLSRILKAKPIFFENVIIKLLVAMGYSNTNEAWEHTGKSGDDGIDGIINQDVLGVDKIYIQAKRYADGKKIGSGDIRNFIGALDMCRAVKGVFVTTSEFTNESRETIKKSSKNIVLMDGKHLTELMIKYGVGCKVKDTVHIYKMDEDFFEVM